MNPLHINSVARSARWLNLMTIVSGLGSLVLTAFFRVLSALPAVLLVILLPFISSCAWLFGDDGFFPDRSSDYLQAEESEKIVLPPGLQAETISEEYPIPELALSQVLPEKFETPRVEPLGAIESQGSVRLQRLDEARWILVNTAPGQVWPLITSYLSNNAIPLSREDGTRGVIETDWLSVDGENFRERYRIALRAGVQPDSSEITVLQLSANTIDGITQESSWGEVSTDAQREDTMLNLLAEYLAGASRGASYSLLAQGIGTVSKVSLNYGPQGGPYLKLELPFDRAWAALGLALGKASYRVNDLNRSEGIYYVRYVPEREEQQDGFFSRLFSWGDEDEGEKTLDDYLIKTDHDGEVLTISVQRELAPALEKNQQAFILKRIQGKIS